MNPVLQNIIKDISSAYSFVGIGIDKNEKEYSFCDYSITVQLLPSWEKEIRRNFPSFNVTNIFSNYYLVGFDK
jgi:hypothetical protein